MRHFALFLSAFSLAVASSASAQLSPGTSGSSGAAREGTEKDYWYIIRYMGNCLAGAKTEQMKEFLATKPASRDEDRVFKKLFNRRYNACMQSFVQVRFRRAHLRGAVAEGLYRDHAAALGESWAPNLTQPDDIASLHDFAQCYVANNFERVDRFLDQTKLGSSDEHRAVVDMAQGFSDCLPQYREVTLDPVEVRLALAEAMYRTTVFAEPAE